MRKKYLLKNRDYYPTIRKHKKLKEKFTEDRIERIKELYKNEFSIEEIASMYSSTESIIREIVDDNYRNQKITQYKKSDKESQKRRRKNNPQLNEKMLLSRREWYSKIDDIKKKRLRDQQNHSRRVISGFYFRRFWELIEYDILKKYGLR